MTKIATRMRALQRFVIGAVVVWVAIHTVLIWSTGWSAWRLGGFGMYTEGGWYFWAASIVACGEPSCDNEKDDIQAFMPVRNTSVPVLRSTPGGKAPYMLVDAAKAPRAVSKVLNSFEHFPSSWNARALLRSRLDSPCGPYLVAHYRQRLSLISKKEWVKARPYVVTMQYTGSCSGGRRVRLAEHPKLPAAITPEE